MHKQPIFSPRTCTRGKAIGFVCHLSVCLSSPQKSPDLEIQASERPVSTTNLSKWAKNWLQYASNPLAQPTSVANSVFMLAAPIGHTYCWPCAFCSCAQPSKRKQAEVINKYMQLSDLCMHAAQRAGYVLQRALVGLRYQANNGIADSQRVLHHE